jgi:hypothetical protein
MRIHVLISCLLTASLLACQGKVSSLSGEVSPVGSQGPGVVPGQPSPSPDSPGVDGPTVVSDEPCTEPEALARAPIRRLTHREYNNTVRDLLSDATQPANAFESQGTVLGFDNNIAVLTVNENQAQKYADTAEALATKATANVGQFIQCDVSAKGEVPCFDQWLTAFGTKTLRQPLSPEDVTRWKSLFTDVRKTLDFQASVQTVLAGLLQSPRFLYRIEPQQLDGLTASSAPLESHALATRLSYLLWGSMPDDALRKAADENALQTSDAVAAQVERMLKDPKSAFTIKHFHSQWLEVDSLDKAEKAQNVFPEFTPAARTAMKQQFERFIDDVYAKHNGSLAVLLSGEVVSANDALQAWYPQAKLTANWSEVTRDKNLHAGFLTLPAVLASHANPNATSPTKRGKFILERLLCSTAPEPPPDANVTPPPVTANTTARERYAAHTTNKSCAGCHRLFDPMGLALEGFDGIGRERISEGTAALDLTGEFVNTDINGTYVGAAEAGKRLATSKMVDGCSVTNWFRYSQGRIEAAGETCQLQTLRKSLTKTKDLRQVVVGIATSNAFRLGGAQ